MSWTRPKPGRSGLLHERRGEPRPSLGTPLSHRPLPRTRRHRSRPSIGRPDPRARSSRRGRRLDPPPSLRPDLESRPPPSQRCAGAAPQPHAPPPRVQAGDDLAAGDRPAVRLRSADRRADPRRNPPFGLRRTNGHELLHPSTLLGIWWRRRGAGPPEFSPASQARRSAWKRPSIPRSSRRRSRTCIATLQSSLRASTTSSWAARWPSISGIRPTSSIASPTGRASRSRGSATSSISPSSPRASG